MATTTTGDVAMATEAASDTGSSGKKQQADSFPFTCTIKAHVLASILSAVDIDKPQGATVIITRAGMKFVVEQARTLQAVCFIAGEVFSHFELTCEKLQFGIVLSTFLDCLQIFASNQLQPTSLQLLYNIDNCELLLILKDKEAVTDVTMKTIELDPPTDFQFHGRDIVVTNKVIVRSEWLKEAFNELDWSSTDVSFLLSPDAPFFRLTTAGTMGSCQVDCAKDSPVFELFECRQTQCNKYMLRTLQPSVKALNLATKTQVRMNSRGTLSLQHLLKTEDKHSCFVEFYMLASIDDDDDDNDNEDDNDGDGDDKEQ